MLNRVFLITIAGLALLIGLIIFLLPTPKPESTAFSDNSFAMQNIRIFDGHEILENYNIIVENGVITGMGTAIKIPKNISILDGSGKTLLPGLIDAHTHVYGAALSDSLRFGVTTNFDMFTGADMLIGIKDKREETTKTNQADLWSAGVLATVPGGHGTQFPVEVETLTKPEEAVAWVTRRIAEGSDYIKLVYMPGNGHFKSLDLATASALITAGHKQGVVVVAHISTLDAAQEMLDADIDGLVHVFADKVVAKEFAAQAARDSVFIIPTLAVLAGVDGQKTGAELADNAQASPYLTQDQKRGLSTSFGEAWPGFDFDIGLQNTLALHKAGVVILAGSDAPNPGTAYGASLHQEMEFLVRAGLTPLEALRAATSAPVLAFGIKDRGVIKVGMRADFLLVTGNPDTDISRSLFIEEIIKNGYVVTRNEQKEPSAAANPPLEFSQLGTFDTDIEPPSNLASLGFIWNSTDDRLANGKSEAVITYTDSGADRSGGALHVKANVKSGFMFPWAGAAFGRSDRKARNIKSYTSISFQIRGTPGTYRAMMFEESAMGAPPTQTFEVTQNWQTITLDMEKFAGFKPELFVGFAITVGPILGSFDYDVDNIIFE